MIKREKKNILIYYEQYGYGGVDTHMIELINNWPDKNNHFRIITNHNNHGFRILKEKISFKNIVFQTINFPATRVISKNIFIKWFNLIFFYIQTFLKIFFILTSKKPDIFIVNNGGFPGGITSWVALFSGVFSLRKTFNLIHHSPDYSEGISFKIATLFSFFIRFTNIKNLTVSNASKLILENKTPLKNIHYIYNGISFVDKKKVKFNFRKKFNITKNKIIVGSLGPIEEHKGHKVIIDAISNSKILKTKVVFIIVGSGKKPYVNSLKKRCKETRIHYNVIFTGFLENNSSEIVKGFDIFVMPTIDFEGFGYSMAEAMLSKVPVIASSVGAIPEIIINNVHGLLVKPNDIRDWTTILENLVLKKNMRLKIGEEGYKRIRKDFTAQKMSERYYQLMDKGNV